MDTPPGFFTVEFHLRFFPAVLRARLRPRPARTGFGNHGLVELQILIAVSAILLALGVPRLAAHPASISGIILTLIGGGGILAVLVFCIRAGLSSPVTYLEFEPFVFVFVLLLGATAALFTGQVVWKLSDEATFGLMIAGGLVGYLAGIAAGLWCQIFGPLKSLFGVLALCGSVGLIVVDIVVLKGFK